MGYANWFFYGLDGEIAPKLTFFWTPQTCPWWALAAIHPRWGYWYVLNYQVPCCRSRRRVGWKPSTQFLRWTQLLWIDPIPIPIPPPRVDSSKGPPWTGWGGPKKCQFWPDLAIQPIKKSFGVSHLSTRHDSRPFNLIWAHPEWTDLEILEISDFWKKWVMGLFLGPLGKHILESWASFLDPQAFFSWFLENKKDVRRLYDQFGGSIAPRSLLCVRKRSFCFGQNIWISRSPDFQTLPPPPPPPPDELSDPNLTLFPAQPGIKYVARSPCCDRWCTFVCT